MLMNDMSPEPAPSDADRRAAARKVFEAYDKHELSRSEFIQQIREALGPEILAAQLPEAGDRCSEQTGRQHNEGHLSRSGPREDRDKATSSGRDSRSR